MNQHALARLKREEPIVQAVPRAKSPAVAFAPTLTPNQNSHHSILKLGGIIGNRAMQRVLSTPKVQRSLWDDVVETVDSATDWLSGNNEAAPQQAWEPEAEPDGSSMNDEMMEHGSDAEFQDAVDADLDTAPDQTSSGSWFDSFFTDTGSQQQEYLTDDSQNDANTNATPDKCKDIEQELHEIQSKIEELFDLSQNMLPAVESAQKEYEKSKKSAPGSAQTQAAKERFDRMLAQYNEVVDQCLQLMAYRDQLRADLAACKDDEKKKMPKGFPCC
ncbi:MAG: hypothetical protein IAE89_11525 [Anaerolineae bacterium]|nr:hypothetical protein [Anaerolineae bacterium]